MAVQKIQTWTVHPLEPWFVSFEDCAYANKIYAKYYYVSLVVSATTNETKFLSNLPKDSCLRLRTIFWKCLVYPQKLDGIQVTLEIILVKILFSRNIWLNSLIISRKMVAKLENCSPNWKLWVVAWVNRKLSSIHFRLYSSQDTNYNSWIQTT